MRVFGLLFAASYAALIVWLYAAQPQTMAEVTGGLTSQVGAYRIDAQAFDDGLADFWLGKQDARAALTAIQKRLESIVKPG